MICNFEELCQHVRAEFDKEWKTTTEIDKNDRLEREKGAILGLERDMEFYKNQIRGIIDMLMSESDMSRQMLSDIIPAWFPDAVEGVFAELYGLAGLSPWVYDQKEEYKESSSAKLIGERLYFLIDGVAQLQPQKISVQRREQLKRALLLASPKERLEKGFHELYLNNGIRVTIYSGEKTKKGQEVMVFRKYLIKKLTFEKIAEMGTIPFEAIDLFKAMIKTGYNVLFAGPVRSGKTTFMQLWQSYEDPLLEGLAISTDPETPWHEIMPLSPIMQLVVDGDELEEITKSLLRGDNDYILLEEMRDAAGFRFALDITCLGTRRSKGTVHIRDAVDLPYRMADKIKSRYGGDLQGIILQVFKNFDYVFEFCNDHEDRSKKILRSISEYCYSHEEDRVSVHRICKYMPETKQWHWSNHFGEDKKQKGLLYPGEIRFMENKLNELKRRNPIIGNSVIYPRYYHPSMKAGHEND